MIPRWALLVSLLVAWCLVPVATVLSLALRHERAGTPPEQRGGVSILPGPVVFPAAGFLLAKGLDHVAGFAIGTTIVFWGHVLFALYILAWIAYYLYALPRAPR